MLRRYDIVRDEQGNYFAIDGVGLDAIHLHSVNTKESFVVSRHEPLTYVPDLREA